MPKNQHTKPYGWAALFCYILTGVFFLLHQMIRVVGFLALESSDHLSSVYMLEPSTLDSFVGQYISYQEFWFQLTAGSFRDVVGFVTLLLFVFALHFTFLFFVQKRLHEKDNGYGALSHPHRWEEEPLLPSDGKER